MMLMKRGLRRNIAVIAFFLLTMVLSGCGNAEPENTVEVGDIIFENDTVKITSVSTDEYLEVFKTKEIKLAYFASDGYPVILHLGGATLSILQNDEKLYDELERSILTVYENGDEKEITDMLEEFFIAKMSDGTFRVYYEVYNEYNQTEDGKTITKYLNLKAFRIEFKIYIEDLEEQLKFI